MPAKLNFFKTPVSVQLVSSRAVSTPTGISGCFQPGQAKVVLGPTRLGRMEGDELEGENKRRGGVEGGWGGGVRGYFTALEGLVGVGKQCGNVTLLHSSPPWSISG